MWRVLLTLYTRLISLRYWPTWELAIFAPLILKVCFSSKKIIKISCALYGLGDFSMASRRLHPALHFWFWSVRFREEYLKRISRTKPELARTVNLTSSAWTKNIGHVALLASLIKLNILGYVPGKLRMYVKAGHVSNDFYLRKYAPFIEFVKVSNDNDIPPDIQESQLRFNMIGTTQGPKYLYNFCALAEEKWREEKRHNLISLTEAERERGYSILSQLGLNAKQWFVTLHVRGSKFREYENQTTRNTSLDHFTLAVKQILKSGGQVIILGEPGVVIPHEMASVVVDYTNSALRSPELDIFLCAECRFFIGVVCGITEVPGTFGVPAVFTNVTPPVSRGWRKNDLWIPKLIWSNSKKRYLSLDEMMTSPVCLMDAPKDYQRANLTLHDNTPEEIADAVGDMLDQVNGKVVDDERLQQCVRSTDPKSVTEPNRARFSVRFAHRRAKELGIKF